MSTERAAVQHELKCLPEFFEAVYGGRKSFEIRRDDRGGFFAGDTLLLNEYGAEGYTGRVCEVLVTYVTNFPDGLRDGFVCMGIERIPSSTELAAQAEELAALRELRELRELRDELPGLLEVEGLRCSCTKECPKCKSLMIPGQGQFGDVYVCRQCDWEGYDPETKAVTCVRCRVIAALAKAARQQGGPDGK